MDRGPKEASKSIWTLFDMLYWNLAITSDPQEVKKKKKKKVRS